MPILKVPTAAIPKVPTFRRCISLWFHMLCMSSPRDLVEHSFNHPKPWATSEITKTLAMDHRSQIVYPSCFKFQELLDMAMDQTTKGTHLFER